MIKDYLDLDLDTEIELFAIDYNNDTFRFCSYSGVVFDGYSYNPIPASIEGIDYSSEGSLSRPKLTVSDTEKLLSGLISTYGVVEGCTCTIQKTLRRFLDGQPSANPNAKKPDDIFVISQMIQMVPGKYIELELSAEFDFNDEELPRRICSKTCAWIYRGSECGYTGSRYFTANDSPTLDKTLDVCGKNVDSCQKRFGKNNVLPFGGFAALSIR